MYHNLRKIWLYENLRETFETYWNLRKRYSTGIKNWTLPKFAKKNVVILPRFTKSVVVLLEFTTSFGCLWLYWVSMIMLQQVSGAYNRAITSFGCLWYGYNEYWVLMIGFITGFGCMWYGQNDYWLSMIGLQEILSASYRVTTGF